MNARRRILAIEDDAELSYLYQSFLTEEGYEVLVARDAYEALRRLRDPPDLILLDLMLPGADGYTLLQEMRARPDLRDVPVIVVSASLPPSRYHVAGADAVVQKPFEFDRLLRTIQEVGHQTHVAH
ncbi:MAG TPA: response regulator transcription factor [Candidatus Limnocylindria bacterium]